jgi:hypothetical protein
LPAPAAIIAILVGAGHNIRLPLAWLRFLLRLLAALLTALARVVHTPRQPEMGADA